MKAAEERFLARGRGYICAHRLGRVGTRLCKGCGGGLKLEVYPCSLRKTVVTIEEDCGACLERTGGAEEKALRKRKEVCFSCGRHKLRDGKLRCEFCRCEEPWSTRAWCPLKKWGMEAWLRQKREYDETIERANKVAG